MTGMPNRKDEKRRTSSEGETRALAAPSYEGACFCGAVEVRVTGQPVVMGYCHCDSCRRWSASPVNGFTLWKPEAVEVTRGREQLGAYQKTERSIRRFCRACGGHLFTEHPSWGVVDVYAATIPSLAFRPAVHVNYAEQVLRMIDGLPKQRDMPAEMGGTGELLEE
ncbi:MAG TPA: GFA family protein [Polyangia bacterium]